MRHIPLQLSVLCAGWILLSAAAPVARASEAGIDSALQHLLQGVDIQDFLEQRQDSELQEGRYEVRPGDTLDALISRIYPASVLRQDMLRRAFVVANPQAFRNQNPNWMLAGKVLRMPAERDLLQLIFNDTSLLDAALSQDPSRWVRFP